MTNPLDDMPVVTYQQGPPPPEPKPDVVAPEPGPERVAVEQAIEAGVHIIGTVAPMAGLAFVTREFFWSWHSFVDYTGQAILQPNSIEQGKCFRVLYVNLGTPFTAAQRSNACVEMRGDWILFMDCDMVFPQDLLARMLNSQQEIVAEHGRCDILSGQYFMRDEPFHPLPRRYHPSNPNCQWPPILEYPEDRPFRADGAGGGCLLMQANVVEALKLRYPLGIFDWMPGYSTEDLPMFLRALEMGFECWIDPRIELGHLQMGVVDSKQHNERKAEQIAGAIERGELEAGDTFSPAAAKDAIKDHLIREIRGAVKRHREKINQTAAAATTAAEAEGVELL